MLGPVWSDEDLLPHCNLFLNRLASLTVPKYVHDVSGGHYTRLANEIAACWCLELGMSAKICMGDSAERR